MFARMLFLVVLGVAVAGTAFAGPAATVIGVEGEALYKGAADGDWQPARVGDELSEGAVLRAAEQGSIVLLRADGALVRVQQGQERPVSDLLSSAEQPKGWRFFQVLEELFADSTLVRQGASRGLGEDAADTGMIAVRERYEAQQAALLDKAELAGEDIPVLMRTAAYFDYQREYGKVVALLDKLGQDFGDRPGFAPLAEWARQAAAQRTWLHLRKFVESEISPLAPGEALNSGSGVQISYGSDQESYLYVILHSVSSDGRVSTMQVYPENLATAKPVAARTELRLPSQEAFYVLDNHVGKEYLVGWSCNAPLSEVQEVDRLVDGVSRRLRSGGQLSDEDVLGMAPPACSRGFVRSFTHES